MICYPNAKINLGLNILRKRADGFHDIESVFYPVNWRDILEIVPVEGADATVEFTSSGIDIPGDPTHNLCTRAYQILQADHLMPSVKIHLHKIVPIGAGLGGGSADASFTLSMLNEMFELGLSNSQLERYAEKLGSDCPFFIKNKPAYVTGKGETMAEIDVDLSAYKIVLINPQIHIGTAEAYSNVKPEVPEVSLKSIIERPVQEWKGELKNDFENSVFPNHRRIETLKNQLYDQGAHYASMTGSGSTVFGIFDAETDLNGVEDCLVKWC